MFYRLVLNNSSCDGEGHNVLMEYNALGQMIRRTDPAGRTETFEYDREGRQKNRYDAEGLRAELEENGRLVRFIYNDDKVISEKTDDNTIRYIRGYELISSDSEAAKTYYHYASDELGSKLKKFHICFFNLRISRMRKEISLTAMNMMPSETSC